MPDFISQYSPRQLSRYRATSVACALFAFAIGAGALLGWILAMMTLTMTKEKPGWTIAAFQNTTVAPSN